MSGIADLEPATKQSLDRVAANRLRDALVSGRIAAGARLTEISLAEQFGLSRGTIRAALQRLVSEGLIVQRPYTGWEVTTLSPHDVWELGTLRASLEGLAGRLAAERIDDAGRTALMNVFRAMEDAARDENQSLLAADLALHRMIVSLSGNERLAHHYDLITNQLRLYIASSNRLVGIEGGIVARHYELIEPILKGDGDAAEQAFRDFFHRSNSELAEFLAVGEREPVEAAPTSKN
ncbi:GntR family transcriptional regulator [Bradyrhizobium sp. Pear77]|uniref:GntR family transcriptional regulator n=1 Tax=Bradyrhizobium TaxID=374 RepID=UPI001E2A5902|nr:MULTISPECIES: GntR family transcriptional regulator [Bradyrhizobium]MCC8953579.1 GntR family transcriptional regulator [Bradyrhizobium altum]MCC8962908.1 GntR family transcriptional regulator [Bradyrhizobium oropedii]